MQTTALNLESETLSVDTGWRTALLISALMALVGLLGVFVFGSASLRLDEAQSLWQSGRAPMDILTIVAQDVHVPLYHELLHFWRLTVGDSVLAARALSLVFYLASIPAMYFLGRLAYSRSAGLFAATLISVSPFMNWYGSEIRMYTLFTLLVILNQISFIKLWKRPSDHVWSAYILTALLGIYVHYFFLLILAAQALFFLVRRSIFPRQSLKRFIFSWAFLAICFAPWAAFVLLQGQASNASPVLSVPTTVNLFSAFSQFVFGFQDDHLNTFLLSLWPLTLIMGFFGLRKSGTIDPVSEYLLLSVIVGISVAFFGSLFIAPVFVSRYLIFTIPALYLLLTSLINVYPPRAAAYARYFLVAAMAVMLCIEIVSPATPVKENYRDASEYLAANAQSQDVIILSAPFTFYPVEYYYRGTSPLVTLPVWDRYAYGPIPAFDESRLPADVERITKDHEYAWLLLSYNQGYEDKVRDYFNNNFEKVSDRQFSPGMELLKYKVRYDTPLERAHAIEQ